MPPTVNLRGLLSMLSWCLRSPGMAAFAGGKEGASRVVLNRGQGREHGGLVGCLWVLWVGKLPLTSSLACLICSGAMAGTGKRCTNEERVMRVLKKM